MNQVISTFDIIPAIDLLDGKCVRLRQGNYKHKTVYSEDPLAVAKQFEEAGIKRLHIVDLEGARSGRAVHLNILKNIATHTNLIIDFGGGIQTDADIEAVYEAGAHLVTVGSVAIKQPQLFHSWIKKYGSARIILAADVKNEKITIHGWKHLTHISVFDFIHAYSIKGVNNFLCTDTARDGMMQGSSLELYKKILTQFPNIRLIASGGISSLKDIEANWEIGCAGVIVGKALYEGKIKLSSLKKFFNDTP